MSWQGIEGHDSIVEYFRRLLATGRLPSTFLFVGPPGIGKRRFAVALAKALLCERAADEALAPCGECASCKMVDAGTHPDLLQVEKPKDKSFLPVKLLIGEDDRRMQEGLCHAISLKPFMGGRRIAIIDDADYLNAEGANCLLKTLEEPPPRSLLILIGGSVDRQLPTILSRSQIVRFRPLPDEVVAQALQSEIEGLDVAEARRLATLGGGSIERARELADPELWKFREELLVDLASPQLESVQLARRISEFVDGAGKEAPVRRARASRIVDFVAEFYRQRLRRSVGAEEDSVDAALEKALKRIGGAESLDPESLADCVSRCLEALEQIDRNANQSAWLECWLDDLSQLATVRA